MKKISVKDLVDFRRKSTRGKKTFVESIKSPKIEVTTTGGGDYWISGLSAICNSYKINNFNLIDEKIDELRVKSKGSIPAITKNMYQRNIDILRTYKSMDLTSIRPPMKLAFLHKSLANSLLMMRGLQIQTKPSHVYTFETGGEKKIGAIWFVAKKDGYQIEEVGVFCEVLYRFLKHNYSKEYELSHDYCAAADVLSGRSVTYADLMSGSVARRLAPTLDEVNKFM